MIEVKNERQVRKHEEEKDFAAQLVDEVYSRTAQGEKPALALLLERSLNGLMLRERDRCLQLALE